MLHYILQTLIFQVLFLALYDAFHKKDTFFNWNRLYLLSTPILSLILPFIKIDAFKSQTPQVLVTQLERVITISSESLVVLGTTGPEQNPTNWWLVLYYTGMGVSLFLLILKLYKLKVLTSFAFKSSIHNKKVVTLPNSNQAFSFWNTIYLGDQLQDEEKKQILTHEIVHVEQKHSLDQIWFEILKILFWWNPMLYIYQSRITILHEYIADEAVVTMLDKRNYIKQLLNAAFQTQEITFVNQFFNQSLIKKRIIMLQKSKSRSIARFKYLLLIPLITGILTYTSCGVETDQSTDNTIENANTTENSDISKFTKNREPKCPNQNAVYDKNLDNFLSVRNGKQSEAIVEIISVETSKKVRTVFITENTTQFIRNIPEGKYKIQVYYGSGYAEKNVNGSCIAYFKKEIGKEVPESSLDFYTVKTKDGLHVPSFNLKVGVLDQSSDRDSEDNTNAAIVNSIGNNQNATTPDTRYAEPKCPNKNAEYDNKIDNYLRLTSGKNAEIIVEIVSLESSKIIRTIHMTRNQVYFIRNIPEGKYKLHLAYGDDYAEKTVAGECKGYFKDEKDTEIDKNTLDFTTIKTEKGLNVPSYNMIVELTDKEKHS